MRRLRKRFLATRPDKGKMKAKFGFEIMQLFLAIASASARDNSPPSPDRPWLPPNLSKYEGELAGQRFRTAEAGSEISIDPRKVYNLARLA